MGIYEDINRYLAKKKYWKNGYDILEDVYKKVCHEQGELLSSKNNVEKLLSRTDWEGKTKDEFKRQMDITVALIQSYINYINSNLDGINWDQSYCEKQYNTFSILWSDAVTLLENTYN